MKNIKLTYSTMEAAAAAIGSKMVNPQGSITESGSPFIWNDRWQGNQYKVTRWNDKNGKLCGHSTTMLEKLGEQVGNITIAFPVYRDENRDKYDGAGDPMLVKVVSATNDEVLLERV